MFKQIAIDPDGIAKSWQRFIYFYDQIGTSQGRLIFRFPKKWEKRVIKSDCFNALKDLEKTRIVELLRRDNFEKQKSIELKTELNHPNDTWLENALMLHEDHGDIDLIITERESKKHSIVMSFDAVEAETIGWKVVKPWRVKREANKLAGAAEQLLLNCKQVKFVDQYFHFNKPRYVNTLKSFLKILESNDKIERVEYHLGLKNKDVFSNLLDEFKKTEFSSRNNYLTNNEDSALFDKLIFHFWHNDRDTIVPGKKLMHARYVLTDIGGLSYDHGLDEDEEFNTDTDIHLIDNDQRVEFWEEYQEDNTNSSLQYLGSYVISENV